MPTHDESSQFLREFYALTPAQRKRFAKAMKYMVDDLKHKRPFRASLRIKSVQKAKDVFEMTWAPDGRATFSYGAEVTTGEAHIIWRRIGGHEILEKP